ncbi:hypothetical protein RJ641_005437 [Dillenia turbinata]|uniref:Uncharacterized protein n=1 Tax=Dillenia turbinata TaxID=194707 RepID=A0AAN8VKU2_9MAGN
MEGEDCGMERKKNEEVKEQGLIDFSIDTNDFLANFSSDETLDNHRFSVFMESRNEPDGLDLFKFENHHNMKNAPGIFQQQKEHLPSESHRQRHTGTCDIRKSLAWDSAFFTSAGVLDPEELSIINRGFEKAEKPVLPQILEDSWGSGDSTFALDTDGISLEILEGDLFEDVRASIQKSSEAYKTASSVFKTGPGGGGQASKKLDAANQNQIKPMSTSGGNSGDKQQVDGIKNEVSYSQQMSGESKFTSLKPPTTSNRNNASSIASTKRASLSANQVKMENRATRTAGGSIMSKKSALGDSCNSSSTFTTPSRSCSTAFTATDSRSAASSTHKRSGGTLSDPTSKYFTNSIKRKVDSRIYSSGSILKTPKTSTRKTTELGNSSSSSLFSSITKVSSTSLSSSFDDWSPESSSSTSSVNQRSANSNLSHDAKPLGGPLLDGDSPQASHSQSHPSDHCKDKPSLRSSSVSITSGVHKPSGLRIPAPKIGFFDEGKSFVPALSGSLQFNSGKHSSPPKSRARTGISSRAATRIRPGDSMKSSKEASYATGTAKIALKSSLKAKEKGTLGLSTKKMGIERKSQRLCPKMKNINRYRDETSLQGDTMKENGDFSISGLENSPHPLPIKAKENAFGFEDPIDSLTRHVQGIDLGRDVIVEFKGKKGPARAVSRLGPSPLSLPWKTETVPRTRTPLAAKESTYNNGGFFDTSTVPNTEKPEEKAF